MQLLPLIQSTITPKKDSKNKVQGAFLQLFKIIFEVSLGNNPANMSQQIKPNPLCQSSQRLFGAMASSFRTLQRIKIAKNQDGY